MSVIVTQYFTSATERDKSLNEIDNEFGEPQIDEQDGSYVWNADGSRLYYSPLDGDYGSIWTCLYPRDND